MPEDSGHADFKCANCGRQLDINGLWYVTKVEMFAAPTPIIIEEEDLERDFKSELHELVEQIKKLDPKELEEQVYVKHELALCQACKKRFSDRIEMGEFL
ncbi:hypothetical protein ACFL1X_09050 [Candidatus Hydrogenedentota bacterium]